MTVNYKLDAMNEIRKYLWSQMVTIDIFNESDYYSDGLMDIIVPIIPVQQSPELNQFLSGKKHIVYDKIGLSYEENWMICCEQVLFTIYATDISEINEIRNFMTDLFRRMDDSARDVNKWSGISDQFKFFSIFLADISPVSPSDELQGFLSADVVLEIKYARMLDSNGRFA
jgi:hypothetical protein